MYRIYDIILNDKRIGKIKVSYDRKFSLEDIIHIETNFYKIIERSEHELYVEDNTSHYEQSEALFNYKTLYCAWWVRYNV